MALPFDVSDLETWMKAAGLLSGPLLVTSIGDGHSNLTYSVSDGERRVVLRRPPPPPTPPGANDVLREARILRAVARSGVPVPTVLATAQAGEVMNVPFVVMEHLDGVVANESLPAGLDVPVQRRLIAEAMVDVLAALHAADWGGLAGIGRPAGYVERQLERLPAILADPAHGATAAEAVRGPGDIAAAIAEAGEALRVAVPVAQPPSLLHGDFRIGNVMLDRAAPARIVGVLDWELATIADPLIDVGYFVACYGAPGEAPNPLTELSPVTTGEGFPGRAELAARYAERTGRELGALWWYEAFATWRLAVLFESRRRRYATQGGDPYFADPRLVASLLAATRRALERR